jgi:DNA-binding NarL/FixJ family response regulator
MNSEPRMTLEERTAVIFHRYPLWIKALSDLLGELGLRVVGGATSVEETLRLVQERSPDVLVADFGGNQRGADAVSLLAAARGTNDDVKCFAICDDCDSSQVIRALAAGATACCLETAQPSAFAVAIRQMFERSIYFGRTEGVLRSDVVDDHVAASILSDALTKREKQILGLVAEGHSNADVAKVLWVTEQTVKFHLSNIYRKLHVSNRTEASRWVQTSGLLEEAAADEAVGSPAEASEPPAGLHSESVVQAPAGDVIAFESLRLRPFDEQETKETAKP